MARKVRRISEGNQGNVDEAAVDQVMCELADRFAQMASGVVVSPEEMHRLLRQKRRIGFISLDEGICIESTVRLPTQVLDEFHRGIISDDNTKFDLPDSVFATNGSAYRNDGEDGGFVWL